MAIKVVSCSETKEFGALDYLRGGLKNGAKNLVSKASGHKFQAGIIYLEKKYTGSGALAFSIKYELTSASDNLGEANAEAKEKYRVMKADHEKLEQAGFKNTKKPIKLFPGRDADRIKDEIEKECQKLMASDRWQAADIRIG